MFTHMKDWRLTAMRFDRCTRVFLSVIQIAYTRCFA
jgi:hypothetical protein